jgi:hypothetical protein
VSVFDCGRGNECRRRNDLPKRAVAVDPVCGERQGCWSLLGRLVINPADTETRQ